MSSEESGHVYGYFGDLGAEYHVARQQFSEESVAFIMSTLVRTIKDTPFVLDVGAGTGIATAQLHELGARVVGADADKKMVHVARQHYGAIPYVVARTDNLPFKDKTYDAATAFSSFHWFTDVQSVHAIVRVLKPGGTFFAVNKNEEGDFKNGHKAILAKYMAQELADAKQGYNPQDTLRSNGLLSVHKRCFPSSEFLTRDKALAHIQSVSWWNFIPKGDKPKATKEALSYIDTKLNEQGLIQRRLNTAVVYGIKSNG